MCCVVTFDLYNLISLIFLQEIPHLKFKNFSDYITDKWRISSFIRNWQKINESESPNLQLFALLLAIYEKVKVGITMTLNVKVIRFIIEWQLGAEIAIFCYVVCVNCTPTNFLWRSHENAWRCYCD